jgi:hypothetical protein
MITFTTSDRADALYYYNGLASGRVVSGSYTADGQVRTFAGIIVSVEPANQPDVWNVAVRLPDSRTG